MVKKSIFKLFFKENNHRTNHFIIEFSKILGFFSGNSEILLNENWQVFGFFSQKLAGCEEIGARDPGKLEGFLKFGQKLAVLTK